MTEVTASLVVQFSDAAGLAGDLSAEIDSRENGFNLGRTSFAPGDSFAYLVYPGKGVTVIDNETSLGRIAKIGNLQISLEEDVSFADTTEGNTQRPIQSLVSQTWIGNSLGSATFSVGTNTLRVPTQGVGILRVQYNVKAEAYRVSNIPTDPVGDGSDFSVLVVITGEFNG